MAMQGIENLYYNCHLRAFSIFRTFWINRYIWWFWFHPVMWVINRLFFVICYGLFIMVFIATAFIANASIDNPVPNPFSSGISPSILGEMKFPIWGSVAAVLLFTLFYFVNLLYATWKRLGVMFSRLCLVDCLYGDCYTYAKVFNYILSETGVNFRMDTHMTPEDIRNELRQFESRNESSLSGI